jgi:hemolysin III
MIYMLIAGTYTPICLITLNGAWGWWLFGVIWFFAVAGTIVKLFWMNAPRWLTAVTYIAMGWMALIAVVPIVQSMQVAPLSLLAAGGLLYTTGAVCYARKWPGKDNPRFGFHEVFHIFVLLGSICHFVMIVLL